ncbi:MAG: SpoIIE family protein phosphatase, partial [Candidatus Marithrix sp.]|nr:SpoIIE family protein phosphatase [Candidatus Marithrix sp.]
IISELEQNESLERLQPAIIEGLLQPLDKNSQFKFLHDRVQQAAYAMIEDKQKQSTHLQIGRLLLKNTSADILEEKLFDIVSQFNKGLTLIVDAEEKLKIAKLNFTVSEKAKESNAYIPAYDYLQNSIYLLNEGTWDNHYDLMLAIYSALSQLTFLMADFSKMDEYIKVVLDNTTNTPDKLYAYEVKMQYLIALGKQSEALQLGFEILSLLDKNLSTELLENINFESIINLPEMTDTASLSAMQILNIMIAPAWASNSTIFEQICLTIINLSYKHGNCSLSSVGYVTYGGILCGKGEIETGYRFGKLGVELADKINVKQVRVRVHILFYSTVMHWKKPVRETVIPFYNAFQLGVDVGDIEYACYALVEPDIYQFLMGANLNTLDKKFSKSLVVVKQLKQDFHYNFLIPCYQAVHNLLGKTEGKVSNLSGVIFDKEELAPKFIKEQQFSLCCAVYQAQTILAFIFRECEDAYQNALLTEKYKESSGGMLFSPVHNFYYSLTLLAKIFTSSEESQKELLELVNKNQVQLKHWANYAPTNFQHKYDLVEAEKARVLGNYWQAVNLYEEAIAGAKKNQYTHEEALAYELAAEFYSSCNMDKFTQIYLKEAYHCYQRWGAIAKVQQLEAKYPQLITTTLSNNIDINNTVISSNVTQLQMSTTLDLDSITKASQTLAGEIVLSKLLEKMMSIMIENAGAERGLLILEKGKSEWVIEAEGRLNIDEIAVLKSISLEGKLPISVVNYVVKTRESVVLDNSLQEGIYTKDDYIQQQQSKSVLCSPILHQGKLIGLLYLENSLMEGAFTSARLRLVDMLSSQVAISLDNALLYHTLETKVEERTGQLATANQEITLLNKRLKKENVRMGAELDVAKQLQQMVLPKEEEFLEIDSLDIAGFMEPAEEVGGDYYEVLNHDGHIKIGIGDVTGHGLESGVIMLMVQTTVRALLLAGIDDPETFLNIVNRTIYHNAQRMDTDKNLTMSLLDYQNGTLQLTGQHEEVLLVRKDGKIELIDTLELGFMVGVIDDIAKFISHQEFTLQPGDGVVLYTDGITEAQNMEEEQYSLERLCEVVSSNWLGNAKKVQQAVITDVKNYIGKQKVLDDITLLVLKQE